MGWNCMGNINERYGYYSWGKREISSETVKAGNIIEHLNLNIPAEFSIYVQYSGSLRLKILLGDKQDWRVLP